MKTNAQIALECAAKIVAENTPSNMSERQARQTTSVAEHLLAWLNRNS